MAGLGWSRLPALNIITPLTRPENLPAIAASMAHSSDLDITWYVVPDNKVVEQLTPSQMGALRFRPRGVGKVILNHVEGESVFGDAQRSWAIHSITDSESWLYFLDDDNMLPQGFLDEMAPYLRKPLDGIIVSQKYGDGRHRLPANLQRAKPTLIDTAQFFVKRGIIGADRWPVSYCSDGIFAEMIFSKNGRFTALPQVFSYYNALR